MAKPKSKKTSKVAQPVEEKPAVQKQTILEIKPKKTKQDSPHASSDSALVTQPEKVTVNQVTQAKSDSSLVLQDEVTKASSDSLLVIQNQVAQAKSDSSLVLQDEVKQAKSDSSLVLQDEVKQAENDSLLVLPNQVKQAESDSSLVLQDEVKQAENDSLLVLPNQVKQAESDSSLVLQDEVTQAKSDSPLVTQSSVIKQPIQEESQPTGEANTTVESASISGTDSNKSDNPSFKKPQLSQPQAPPYNNLEEFTTSNGETFVVGEEIKVKTANYGEYTVAIKFIYAAQDGSVWASYSHVDKEQRHPWRWGCCRVELLKKV